MAIKTIEITGYRSIRYMKIEAGRIVTFIGQNGSGKSNLLSVLNYFYRNLLDEWDEKDIFDLNNRFSNEVRIKIVYDLKNLLRIVQHNRNSKASDYEKYYSKIQGISHRDTMILELLKRKGRAVEWNVDYNTRQIIASLFPIYFIDARQIELTDWANLWELIGDLVKLRYEDSEKVQEQVREIVEVQDHSLARKLTKLREILKSKGFNVKTLTTKQLGKIIAEIMVGGQIFQYEHRSLEEYSNGTNAYNYTNILIEILSLMKQYKLKEPIVVLDEPEISLHLGMIDELMENIFEASPKIQFFLSTHSSRCVKDLLEREIMDFTIYHVVLRDKYSQIRKVRNLTSEDTRERVIITEAYTNSCFAKMVLNVEGETELEVFKNKYLRELFPELKSVEIVKGMSNRTIHNLTSPSKRNYQTPGLAVIDMDKLLVKKENLNRFKFEGIKDYPILNEAYYYGQKRIDTLYLRKRILRMCNKCNFYYKLPFFSCEDSNFQFLLDLIITYCGNYHIFVWKNTIEGALINADNLSLFEEFMKKELEREQKERERQAGQQKEREEQEGQQPGKRLLERVEPFLAAGSANERLNYVRLVFSGKSDYLLTKKQIKAQNKRIYPELWSTFSLINKTSGWVSRWLEFYFLRTAGIDEDAAGRFEQFRAYLSEERKRSGLERRIREDFYELYCLLQEIKKQMTHR